MIFSIASENRIAIIGIAVMFFVAVGSGIFKATNYRLQVYREWKPYRVGSVIAGLDEFAMSIIIELQKRTSYEFSNRTSEEFWPSGPPPDPASFKYLVSEYARAMKYRDCIEDDVERLMNVGLGFVFTLTGLAVGALLVTIHFTEIVESTAILTAGYYVSGTSIAAIIAMLVFHMLLQNRLANAEMMSDRREG